MPARQLGDFVYIHVFFVEPVAGPRVCGKLGPEFVNSAAFAEATPKTLFLRGTGGGCWIGGRFTIGHGKSIGHSRGNARARRRLLFAFQRAAELNLSETEAVAKFVGGSGELFEFLAARRVQEIELFSAVGEIT